MIMILSVLKEKKKRKRDNSEDLQNDLRETNFDAFLQILIQTLRGKPFKIFFVQPLISTHPLLPKKLKSHLG